jgi:hypothetical protein
MKATRGLALLIFGIGLCLTGCTDNTGAIDQEGHNGYDKMACTDFSTIANEVTHGAMTVADARSEAAKLNDTSQRGGDPMVRQAGSQLANAYRANNPQAVSSAMAQFRSACTW